MLAAVKARLETQTADCSTVQVQGVTCLSGCKRPCAVALLATGRVIYLFGDLPADSISAAELLRAAHNHATAPDGWLPRAARSARLRTSILARMSPLHWLPAAGDESLAWPA